MHDLALRYLAELLIDAINSRFEGSFHLTEALPTPGTFVAADGDRRLAVYVAPLWEHEAASDWQQRLDTAALRFEGALPGRYLLWVPPGAAVPVEEQAASDFVRRVGDAGAQLAPGERTEVTFPVSVRMAKMREEGGYASVTGGLSRWWTRITENVNGTYTVDSTTVHRITHDGPAREELWKRIGQIALGVEVGQVATFDVDEAWTLQRLSDGAGDGFALIGAPPNVDPDDGVLVRRTARRRLQAANEAFASVDAGVRAAGLLGAYEYADVETASGTIKALDPSLFARTEIVSLLTDGDVKHVFLPRMLGA